MLLFAADVIGASPSGLWRGQEIACLFIFILNSYSLFLLSLFQSSAQESQILVSAPLAPLLFRPRGEAPCTCRVAHQLVDGL
jgi:hypothetical protein